MVRWVAVRMLSVGTSEGGDKVFPEAITESLVVHTFPGGEGGGDGRELYSTGQEGKETSAWLF